MAALVNLISNAVLTADPQYQQFNQQMTQVSHASKVISALGIFLGGSLLITGLKVKGKLGAACLCLATPTLWAGGNAYQISSNVKTIVDTPGTYYNVFTHSINRNEVKTKLKEKTLLTDWVIDPLIDNLPA